MPQKSRVHVAKRGSPRRVSVVDLASETQLGRQVLAFNDDESCWAVESRD